MKMGFSRKEITSEENYSVAKGLPDNRQYRPASKSNLTLMKPRDKMRPVPKSALRPIEPVFHEANLFSTDKPTALEEIRQSEEIAPLSKETAKATNKNKIRSDSVTFKRSENIETTIQIGVLSLGDIDKIGEIFRKKHLPLWQFTAFNKATGAVWASLAHEFGRTQLNTFVKYLSDNFNKAGKATAPINIEFHFDITTGKKLNREDYNVIREYCSQYFAAATVCHNSLYDESPLNEFHCAIIQKFYFSEKVATAGKLLDALYAYLLRYNFNENYETISDLPPYQLICQQEGGPYRREILANAPIILDRNIGTGINYLSSLRLLAGGMVAFLASVITQRKKNLFIKSKLRPLHDNNSANSLSRQTTHSCGTDYEYISLKDVAWKRAEENSANSGKYSHKIRNRQEIISRALKLLAEKRPMAELKRDLPITEGEISILSRNLMLNKEVRIS